ncbi:MAG: putative secondary metabolism biosynthetic enzyme [Bathelium mastoideum]|nr:MAG: putative secondary metabolism biosynthetic enzyme [Bathelium mastoideum]
MIESLLKEHPMTHFKIPELAELIDETPVDHIPFNKLFEEYRMKPWLLLHTSGSTGIPKIVPIRHGVPTTLDAFWLFGNELADRCGNMRLLAPFPSFHIAGIIYSIATTIYCDSTIVLPPVAPLTAELIDAIHVHGQIEYSAIPPSLIVELAKDKSFLPNLRNLRGLTYAGGPLSKATGDILINDVSLNTSLGATEFFGLPIIQKDPQFWQYFKFNVDWSGLEFREIEHGLYELVIVRKPELDLMQAVFVTFPDIQEYHTKDLFSKHPTEPDLWKYESRLDDVIVFNNGEKLNPVTMEGIISSSPDVTGCLVVGQGKFQAALLIEAKRSPIFEVEEQELKSRIWSYVERANQGCVKHGRIVRELLFFTDADKPLPRAGKGTVQRQRGNAIYKDEIDELFEEYNAHHKNARPRLDLSSQQAAVSSILDFIHVELGIGHLSSGDDFFQYGMDSLQLISLVRAINIALTDSKVEPKQVYEHPSVEDLVHFLLSEEPLRQDGYDSEEEDVETWVQMQKVFQLATWNLPKDAPKRGRRKRLRAMRKWPSHHEESTETLVRSTPKPSTDSSMAASSKDQQWPPDSQKIASASYADRATAWGVPEKDDTTMIDEDFLISIRPPDGGTTAWLQVLAAFLINVNNWGLVNSFGIYQAYYEANLLKSYSASSIAWIGTIQGALLLIVGALSGPLFDKGYFKLSFIISGLGLVFAQMMLSLSTRYYQIMLAQGVLTGLCCGLLYIPSVALMPLYFKDRRGLALGLATGGGSIGGIVYPIVFRRLLVMLDFAWAVRIMGFIVLATLLLAALIIHPLDHIKKPTRQLFDLSALRELPMLAFIITGFFIFCAFLVPYFLTTVYAISVLHTSQDTAFYLVAVINAAQFLGRTIPAFASDFIGGEALLFSAQILGGILSFSWIAVNSLGGFITFLVFYGFASGMMATLPAVVLPYICPSLAVLGTRLGMVYAAAGVGTLISGPVATAAANATHNFLGAQLWMGPCFVVGAACFTVTGVAAWKQRQWADRPKVRRELQ